MIEVDGGIHTDPVVSERDKNRTHELEQLGITVKRITNAEIKQNMESALIRIEGWLNENKLSI